MAKPQTLLSDALKLRRLAEARLREKPRKAGEKRPELAPHLVLHELLVHQVELEMQNLELLEARERTEALLEKYTDFYDFAPMGYFSLTASGLIQMVNLTGASLVGIESSLLVGQSLLNLFTVEQRPLFKSFLKGIFMNEGKQTGNFDLLRKGHSPRVVNIEAQCAADGRECRAVVTDITERKQAELVQQRLELLTASNVKLEQEIMERKAIEKALKKSEQHQRRRLKQVCEKQEQLRELSHQILHAQEEERSRISRELHDVIAQTLVGINVHLSGLTLAGAGNPRSFQQKIARTKRLAEKSVELVHQFALELRPSVLDDLGLVPALQLYMKDFMKRTGISVYISAYAGLEKLEGAYRIVLYRIAQEALTNVARHAHASHAVVSLQNLPGVIRMEIKDDGHGFDIEGTSHGKSSHLGLLAMRERIEMVGGIFSVQSTLAKGTVIRVEVPLLEPVVSSE